MRIDDIVLEGERSHPTSILYRLEDFYILRYSLYGTTVKVMHRYNHKEYMTIRKELKLYVNL